MPQLDLACLNMRASDLAQLRQLLARYVPQAQVWAYGSRVNGQSHDTSDLDLVLRNPSDLKKPMDELWDLKEALENSSIAILVDVHDWAYLPESFHRNIERAYVELQEVPSNAQ
jgi:predicted nucleotidyltransferase